MSETENYDGCCSAYNHLSYVYVRPPTKQRYTIHSSNRPCRVYHLCAVVNEEQNTWLSFMQEGKKGACAKEAFRLNLLLHLIPPPNSVAVRLADGRTDGPTINLYFLYNTTICFSSWILSLDVVVLRVTCLCCYYCLLRVVEEDLKQESCYVWWSVLFVAHLFIYTVIHSWHIAMEHHHRRK